jgi:hypothetical protein
MRFTVPQFIDVEDKILGPLTARQFLIMLFAAGIVFLDFKLFDTALFLLTAIPEFALCGIFAFLRVNGQPFHIFLLNLIQTFRRPGLRVWDKALNTGELLAIIKAPPPPPPPQRIRKAPLAETRLAELSLVVNTGGVYNPES